MAFQQRKTAIWILAAGMLAAGSGQWAVAGSIRGFADNVVGSDLVPTGKGWGEQRGPTNRELANFPGAKPGGGGGGPKVSNGISYHGGPLITAPLTIYYIWYGNWGDTSGTEAQAILNNLAASVGGSPYFNINITYHDGGNHPVQNSSSSPTAYGLASNELPVYVTNYSTALSDSDVKAVVNDQIAKGALPADPNGVYFVLTSKDVNETSGFCTRYCGWHTHASMNFNNTTTDIKYSFVGDPQRCPSACSAQSPGPNGSSGADGMASVILHELEEAATDPDLNAWYDSRGMENADKCAWTFGTTYTANGAQANMNLGGRDYLIQRNWVNASGGYCALSY